MPIMESTVMADAQTAEKPPKKKKHSAAKPKTKAGAPTGRVKVRHFCQGIGDCHLLGFPKPEGGTFWMLIDCGVHRGVEGGSDIMDRVLADIAATTDHHLDVVVVTHEHMDHVSAFPSAAGRFKSVGEVWMGWTEDPDDPQAVQLDKFKGNALAALDMAGEELKKVAGLSPHFASLAAGLDAIAGFHFGLKGERVRDARDAVFELAKDRPIVRYLEPTDPPITVPGLPNLRIFVLGPPRDAKLLGITERRSEMFGTALSGWPIAQALSSAFVTATGIPDEELQKAQAHMPFEPNVGADIRTISLAAATEGEDRVTAFARESYFGRPGKEDETSWRRIDSDWLSASADLAMQLDSKTNNTSLVLAFEFIDTGRVLLFAADAQVGSWLSWHDLKWELDEDTVTGPDLLARTVYYKVSHHCSHNATLRQKGLDMMTHRDLSAFVPTNKEAADKIGWHEMPFDPILEALGNRCRGRVIRADDKWLKDKTIKRNFTVPGGSIESLNHDRNGLWVELDLA
jgi:hypothetical protein